MPFTEVLTPEKTFKSKDQLIEEFKKVGLQDPVKDRVILTCQRGITACILEAALDHIGN